MFKFKFHPDFVDDRGIRTRLHEGTVYLVDRPKTSLYARSLSFLSRHQWNSLPASLRSTDDYGYFKVMVKKHHNNLYFDNDDQGVMRS